VADLAEGGAASLLTKKTTLVFVLLVSLTLGIGGLLAQRAISSRTLAEAPATPAPQSLPARSASKDEALSIKGRVLDPGGKPLAGARLLLRSEAAAKKAGVSVRATTDKDGLFQFQVPAADFGPQGKTTLAASAQGFGPDWIELTTEHRNDLTLRLVKDDVPIEGRVLDLEGKPIAGVTIEVQRLARKAKDEDLTSWLDQHVRPRGHWGWENGLQSVRADFLDVPGTVTTGADGKFHLSGLGRERVLRLKVHGPTVEHRVFWAMTRKGPSKGLMPGDYGFYPATFDMVIGPAKPIVGTVRDKGTGKPLAGIIVEDGRGKGRALTDKDGRYRLLGVTKQAEYHLSAGGGAGRPYFDVSKHHIADSPGLEPLTVDFELERGIEVTGRLTDRVTGQSVRGTIHYFTPPDNPNLKHYTTLDGPKFLVSDWGQTRPDGNFTVLTIPGPGVLVACMEKEDRFALIDASRELQKMNIHSAPVDPAYAIVRINPDEKEPKSLRCDIALEPGRSLSGLLVDPDGKPLTGVHYAGLSAPRFFFAPVGVPRPGSQGLKSAQFTTHALDPRRPRAVVFFHPEKKLGKVVRLRGDEKTPFTVRLEALGAVGGRIINADGKPLAGLQVTLSLNGRLPVTNDALSTDLFESGLAERMTARATTDASGKFRIDGLLPGVPYSLQASEKRGGEETPAMLPVEGPNIESGKTKDLGDLKSKRSPEK
jgi:protocatechuate 3,4-dioxygenase beta subunit